MTVQSGMINSHNEWDTLREIIVGTAKGSMGTLTWTQPIAIPSNVQDRAYAVARQAFPGWFLDEVAEDLEGLAETLRSLGIKVYRPEPHDLTGMFRSPFWASTSNNIYNTRDLHLVVGNTVIESPSHMASRYFEASALYPIWYKYLENGFRWIAAPKPKLDYEAKLPYYREGDRLLTAEDLRHQTLTGGRLEKLHKLAEREILFEAANTVRMGRDLLYLVSSSGNHLGARWLQSVLGNEYRVHVTEDIYRSSHIDSTVLCLRPGLVILNSARVNEQNCPKLFEKWEKIYFDDVAPTSEQELDFQKTVRDPIAAELNSLGFETDLGHMCSPWVGMNFLSVDPQTVIVDERQVSLIRMLESHKITTIPVRMRHIYTQGGGIHCATLDTVRDSRLECYFD